MGCCFSATSEEGRPLLGRSPDGRVRTDSVPQVDRPRGFTNENYRYVDKPAESARRYRPPDSPVNSENCIKEISMKRVGISEVDKRLEDHATLFNTQVSRWQQLEELITEMQGLLPNVNTGKNLQDLFYHIRAELACDDEALSSVVVKRRFKYSMEIKYDDSRVGYTILPAFLAFNKANKLIKEIIDKGPPIVSSIQLVIKDEKNLRREVLVASLGDDGPDCMKACMENIAALHSAIEKVDDIRRGSLTYFEELKAAVTPLIAARK